MDLRKLFEAGRSNGLFTDYQVSVRGPIEFDDEGGDHISSGARMFDIASLTKAFTHLVYLMMFADGRLSPESLLSEHLPVPGAGDRRLWHLLCYLVQDYRFDFNALREGRIGPVKDVLLGQGFADWKITYGYDNYASVYLGLALEQMFGRNLESVIHKELGLDSSEIPNLLFHPVVRELRCRYEVVPTSNLRDGRVYDPLARTEEREHLSVAGLFGTASVIADVFHRNVDRLIDSGYYDIAAQNQLEKVGISSEDHTFALGFDIPYTQSISTSVEMPVLFAGHSGCRVFCSRDPRVTVCFLTNRVYLGGDSVQSRRRFSGFSWEIIREVLRSVTPTI